MDEDSDDDDDENEILGKMEDLDDKDGKTKSLGPDDSQFPGELADGVNRIRVSLSNLYPLASTGTWTDTTGIQLKRAYDADQDSASASPGKSPGAAPLAGDITPPEGAKPIPGLPSSSLFSRSLPDDTIIGSPLKKARPSIAGLDDDVPAGQPRSFPPGLGDVLARAEAAQAAQNNENPASAVSAHAEEEEL